MKNFYKIKDSTFKAHIDTVFSERQKLHEESRKILIKQEKDSMNGYYEAELRHYERQRKILLGQLETENNPYKKNNLKKSLEYNAINIEKTLLLIRQRDNVK